MTQSRPKLIYVTDPMCSWCYGFSPEIKKVRAHFHDLELQLVMGGLRPYHTEHIFHMQAFLREHWDQVRLRSGQPFNYDILYDPDFIYDTEPPARATIIVRRYWPEQEFDFFCEVQKAFYLENRDTSQIETYLRILKKLNLDKEIDQFKLVFDSEETRSKTRSDFEYAASLGGRGFPTLLLKSGSQYLLVCRGYQEAQDIIDVVESSVNEL